MALVLVNMIVTETPVSPIRLLLDSVLESMEQQLASRECRACTCESLVDLDDFDLHDMDIFSDNVSGLDFMNNLLNDFSPYQESSETEEEKLSRLLYQALSEEILSDPDEINLITSGLTDTQVESVYNALSEIYPFTKILVDGHPRNEPELTEDLLMSDAYKILNRLAI